MRHVAVVRQIALVRRVAALLAAFLVLAGVLGVPDPAEPRWNTGLAALRRRDR